MRLTSSRPDRDTERLARACATLVLASSWLVLAPAAWSQDRLGEGRDQDRAYKARNSGEVRSLDSAVGNAKGKILDAEIKDKRYRVKILEEDGRVRRLDVDASDRGSGRGRDDSRGGRDDNRGGGRDDHEGSGGRGRGRGR